MTTDPSGATKADDGITLGLLNAIERDAGATQRSLSKELGIALGSVNWHLKRCARKGLIKVQQAPLKRYAYYLTPTGFEEKGRLTLQYVQTSFSMFRTIRQDYADLFRRCRTAGHRHVLLAGSGELAEAAILSAAETEIDPVGLLQQAPAAARVGGLPVYPDMPTALNQTHPNPTAMVLCQADDAADFYRWLRSQLESVDGWAGHRIVLPRTLAHLADPAPAEEDL